MTDSNNILEFPRNKIVRDGALNTDAIKKLKEKSTQNFADAIVGEMSDILMQELEAYGIDTETDAFGKDYYLLMSVASAMIYRTLEIDHPFHEFIDSQVRIVTSDENEDEEEIVTKNDSD